MTVGPVTANWLLNHTGLEPALALDLLSELAAQGALERIHLGPRAANRPALAEPAPAAGRKAMALRFPWRQSLAAAVVCLGVSAALDSKGPVTIGPIALPALPLVSG